LRLTVSALKISVEQLVEKTFPLFIMIMMTRVMLIVVGIIMVMVVMMPF